MKLERLALVTTLALSAAACAADRSKEVKSAETNLTSAQMKAKEDEARLKQKQAQEQAKEQAELQAKQLSERAETREEGEKRIAEAKQDVATAHAGMQSDRESTEANARSRLEKADARFTAAKKQIANEPAKKRGKLDSDMNIYNSKKAEVDKQLKDLSRVPDDKWQDAKAKLDKSLDELERFADRIHSDL
jgi:DNA repair exonuclease SbcCD ATPase subunit